MLESSGRTAKAERSNQGLIESEPYNKGCQLLVALGDSHAVKSYDYVELCKDLRFVYYV